MTDYVKSTNFTAKDSLPQGDANKVIRGSEFDTEFNAIATAVATKSNNASPTFTGTATFDGITATGTVNLSGLSITFSQLDAGAVTLSSETFSDVDNQIPTNAAVIDYVAGAIPGIAEVNDLTAVVTWANVPDANITQSSVTQHQAALSITASQLSDVTATATEINYVDGVTSNIQTQIDNINPSPIHTATASGTLANGDTVIVNSDGTVSAVSGSSTPEAIGTAAVFNAAASQPYDAIAYDANAQKVVIAYRDGGNSFHGTAVVGTVSGTSISFGTPVVFESADSRYMGIAYDANTQKVVIAYQDQGNSNYGTAIVGTVSGTSISFGTAVVFNSAATQFTAITYDPNAQKVVIAYHDDGNLSYGTAIVGTVSGTSISFGTAVVFESATTQEISLAYDSNAQKVVLAYQDVGNSFFGTAIVGTVSGTSISFGTPVVFDSATTYSIGIAYDSNAQKVVIAYRDGGNSNYGTAIVGTVSGTSISFGNGVVFNSGSTTEVSVVYHSAAQKVVIVYQDNSNSNYGTLNVGIVSGTSITFDGEVVFESAATDSFGATYDSNAEKVVIAYRDGGNSNYGTALVYQVAFSNTNLTAENYIGISDAAYSDATTATIQLVGSVDDAQTGLTAGQKYYVQADGSLGLTAADPEVFAGTAVSATKLIVKG
jgi:hypothetical protein